MGEGLALGIDIGATNFRLGLVSSDGVVLERRMEGVGRDRSARGIVSQVERCAAAVGYNGVVGVGIGVPGIVDPSCGVVYRSPHYPKWLNEPVKEMFEDTLGLPVVLDNDANMAASGEGWRGAASGMDNFIMITLGTGVGGGIVCGGRLFRGEKGFTGEIGHMVVDFDGPSCACGGRGCLETYTSASGIPNILGRLGEGDRRRIIDAAGGDVSSVTPRLLYELAKGGDPSSSLAWRWFGRYLGVGIASLVNITGIFNIVIGGGISRAWDCFISHLEDEMKKRLYKESASFVRIVQASLLDDAGILGGANEVFKSLGSHGV